MVFLFILIFLDLDVGRPLLRVLKLAVPSFLDSGDSLVAEVEPTLKLRTLLNRLFVFGFFLTALLIIESFLSNVAELKRDLYDLSKVHAGRNFTRWIMEVCIRLQLSLNETFHCLEIFPIKNLSDQVKDEKALLVGDRAELKGAHHK